MTLQYFTDQTMTQKIQNKDTDIKLITRHLNRIASTGNIIFSKTVSVSDAFHRENNTTKLQDVQLGDAALVLENYCQTNQSRYQKI